MKKMLSLLLVCAMLLGLCACANSAAGEGETTGAGGNGVFMAGFSQVDITPFSTGIKMDGYGNASTRLSTGIKSYIYAIAVAVTDAEGNSAVVMSVDTVGLSESFCDEIRSWAQKTHGIPAENIIISATHHHSCPIFSDGNYTPDLQKGIQDAITKAMADRAPAELYMNQVETEALTFARRAWFQDGGFVTAHSGDRSSGYSHDEFPIDETMRLLKFTREGADDIIMVNFQVHPQLGTNSSSTEIHADFIGVMRDEVTEKLGVNCIYFTGASGNLSPNSYDKTLDVSKDFKDHGKRAAQYVIAAEDSYTKVNTGTIRGKAERNQYLVDHSQDHLLEIASAVQGVRASQGIAAAHKEAEKYPELNSAYQATSITVKAALGENKECNLTVVTFGDVAFSAHPYEMFDHNAVQLREGTVGNDDYLAEHQLENPYAMTFVMAPANGNNSYIPSAASFDNGGYERDQTKYARGEAEKMVGDALQMLNELYNAG